MNRLLLIVLLCTSSLVTAEDAQAQAAPPRGPVSLERAGPSGPMGPIYTMNLVEIGDAKRNQYIWLLEKQITFLPVGTVQPTEPQRVAFMSLNSSALRTYVSHLPVGARLLCTTFTLPGPDPTMKIGISSAEGFQGLVDFCRVHKINFQVGIPF